MKKWKECAEDWKKWGDIYVATGSIKEADKWMDSLGKAPCPNPWRHELSQEERAVAAQEAEENNRDTAINGYQDQFKPENRYENDFQSRCAERALFNMLNLPLNRYSGNTKGVDMGRRTMCRSTQKGWCLPLYPKRGSNPHDTAHGDCVYVLVSGKSPVFHAVGWIEGKDAMQAKYWRAKGIQRWDERLRKKVDGIPCWVVETESLNPMSTFPREGA